MTDGYRRLERRIAAAATALVLGAFLPAGASADGTPTSSDTNPPVNQSVVSDRALSNVQGALGLNETAGNGNAQGNVLLLDASHDGSIHISQQTAAHAVAAGRVSIEGGAFSRAAGIIRVNQIAGDGNAQVNVVAIGPGIAVDVLSDAALSTASATSSYPAGTSTARQQISVSASAFAGARGIVQLDQTAGSGNSATNDLTLRIGLGGK
jgi:hypothetical protein